MNIKKKVFVIMPFEDKFLEVYEMLKLKFNENYDFNNAGEEGNQQNILKDIIQPIYETDIILADLTGLNPNVLYELGIAHTFNKKTIIITQDELSSLPFDLKQYRAMNYSTHFLKFEELIKYLENNFDGARTGTTVFSNPVKDFLSTEGIKDIEWFNKNNVIDIDIDGEKGFLDFLAEIENDTEDLTKEIEDMTADLTKLTDGISKSSIKIEEVNAIGGSGNTSFIRKEAKKVGKFVENFGLKLQTHNSLFSSLWDKIESNINGLLENQFAANEDNRESLIGYIKALNGIRHELSTSDTSVGQFRTAMIKNRKLERSLTQAINITDNYLGEYLNFTEQMSTSIDRIIDKSKFVVGIIEFD